MKRIVIGVLVIGGLVALIVWLVSKYGRAKEKAKMLEAGGNDVRRGDTLTDDGPTGLDARFYAPTLGTDIEVVV